MSRAEERKEQKSRRAEEQKGGIRLVERVERGRSIESKAKYLPVLYSTFTFFYLELFRI